MNKTERLANIVIKMNNNMLVPWYLMACYLYYHLNRSLVSDAFFDTICKELDRQWYDIKHEHKHLVDRMSLKSGTGFILGIKDYPSRVKNAAWGTYLRNS